MGKSPPNRSVVLAGILFIFALFVGLYQVDKTSLHMDEVIWMVNSKELFYALLHRNSNYLENAWWNNQQESYAIGLPSVIASGLSQFLLAGNGKFSFHLLSDIVAARLPGAIISSTFPVFFFLVISRFFPTIPAVLAALAFSLSPPMLTMSRWLLHDNFLNYSCFLALVSFYWLNRKQKPIYYSLIPGVFFALALLTKPSAVLILLPWLFLLITSPARHSIHQFISTLIITFVAIQLLWPESWYHPVFSYIEYFRRQARFADVGLMNHFRGLTLSDPGPWYYPFELTFKSQIGIVILFLIGSAQAVKGILHQSKYSRFIGYIALFALPYAIILSGYHAKPGVRYLLPIYPFIYLIVALGVSWAHRRLSKPVFLLFTLIFVIDLCTVFVYHPDYQLYYNPLVGGAKGIQKYTRTNVCLGSKAALEYLDSEAITGSVYIYGCQDNAPYYSSRSFTKKLDQADIFIVEQYISQLYPDDAKLQYIYRHPLVRQVSQYGLGTAYIYRR